MRDATGMLVTAGYGNLILWELTGVGVYGLFAGSLFAVMLYLTIAGEWKRDQG